MNWYKKSKEEPEAVNDFGFSVIEDRPDPESVTIKGNNVIVQGQLYEDALFIQDFISIKYGVGNARKALRLLKEQYGRLDVDAVVPEAMEFWKKMQGEGLVQDITLYEGGIIKAEEFVSDSVVDEVEHI